MAKQLTKSNIHLHEASIRFFEGQYFLSTVDINKVSETKILNDGDVSIIKKAFLSQVIKGAENKEIGLRHNLSTIEIEYLECNISFIDYNVIVSVSYVNGQHKGTLISNF